MRVAFKINRVNEKDKIHGDEIVTIEYQSGTILPKLGDIINMSNFQGRVHDVIYKVHGVPIVELDPVFVVDLICNIDVVIFSKDVVEIGTPHKMAEILRTFEKVRVTFKKKDGTIRIMDATLHKNIIDPLFKDKPVEDVEKVQAGAAAKLEQGLVTVYDVMAQDWRSFKFDNIISVEYPDEFNNIIHTANFRK